ncbi:GTP-binding protein [Flavobacteriaceae bacterium]|nr:GTP-binding protein [Flavobacteriaceae bacterium]
MKNDILRFTTAGSVDDGKSTLIGRLLYDSKNIPIDLLESIEKVSNKKRGDYLDLSLLTDGLKSEREQGITIDVAYRYFSTKKRKFIIADTPGHSQFTRNMVTGASNASLALIVIDSTKGISEQTFRHTFLISMLGIKHVIICINKIDLVKYEEKTYVKLIEKINSLISKLKISDVRYIPISALYGDNIVEKSDKTPWYQGPTLMYILENIHIASDKDFINARLPIQDVIRPQNLKFQNHRSYSGKILGGIFRKGDEVEILPSGFKTKIESISVGDNEFDSAGPLRSVSVKLKNDFDISRGDMLIRPNNKPEITQNFNLIVFWMSISNLEMRKKLIIKHTTNECIAIVEEIFYKIDINSYQSKDAETLELNEIGKIRVRTSKPLFVDSYYKNRDTGSIILIDQDSKETVGAAIIN